MIERASLSLRCRGVRVGGRGRSTRLWRPIRSPSPFIPEIATTPSSYAAKQPLVDMLARATKRTVKLVIPTNYAATVEAVGATTASSWRTSAG